MWSQIDTATEWPRDADPAGVFDLPMQLQPYQEGRIEAVAPPSKGRWRAGSVVWNRAVWDVNVTGGQPVGWVCSEAGKPGRWANLSIAAPLGPA